MDMQWFEVCYVDNVGQSPKKWFVEAEAIEKVYEYVGKVILPALKTKWRRPRKWMDVNVARVPEGKASSLLSSRESCTQPDAN